MGALFSVAIFATVIMLAAMLFTGWVMFIVVRALIFGVMSMFGVRRTMPLPMPMRPTATVRCQTQGCRAINPADARFCRRCGRGLPAAQPVQVRRAAVW